MAAPASCPAGVRGSRAWTEHPQRCPLPPPKGSWAKEDLGAGLRRPPPTSTPRRWRPGVGAVAGTVPLLPRPEDPRCARRTLDYTHGDDWRQMQIHQKKKHGKCISKQNVGIHFHLLSLWLYPGGPPQLLKPPQPGPDERGGWSEGERWR